MGMTIETDDPEELCAMMCDNEIPGECSGLFECFHCGERALLWDSDFTFEDYGREGSGLVHVLHCTNCGADVEYFIPDEEESE